MGIGGWAERDDGGHKQMGEVMWGEGKGRVRSEGETRKTRVMWEREETGESARGGLEP